jgi:hypothetical protein
MNKKNKTSYPKKTWQIFVDENWVVYDI